MSGQDLARHLWNDTLPENSVSERERALIFEQYKLYVEMADRISGRRDKANAFFLSLNGLILSGSGAAISKLSELHQKGYILIPFAVICLQLFFWRRLILSYKQLNGAKFRIIGEMESKLPSSPYGRAEWKYLLKEGTDHSVYFPLTHLESKVPWLFFVGYLIAIALILFPQ
jgi:hypothetical protein